MGSFSAALVSIGLMSLPILAGAATGAAALPSGGRAPDGTAKRIAEFREAERRKIPLEISLRASPQQSAQEPVHATVMLTNLLPEPVLLNGRLLVNHPRLEGELAFDLRDNRGRALPFKRLITARNVRAEEFQLVARGQTLQRTVDLADLFGTLQKGSYLVSVTYRNDIDQPVQGVRAWKGMITSEPITIEIR